MPLTAADIAAKAKQKVIAQATGGFTAPMAPTGAPSDLAGALSPVPIPQNGGAGDPMALMAQALRPYLGLELNVDDNKVRAIIEAVVLKHTALPVSVTINNAQTGETKTIQNAHPMLADLIDYLDMNEKPYLVGPAGSFKTTNMRIAATQLGYSDDEIHIQSVSQATTEGKLLGFIDAHGVVTCPMFRRAYVEGGFYGMDEIDNGSANALAVLNAAIDNGHCGFPDGMKARHPRFRFCAAGNTYGKGADRQYVGRNQLDAATLNRLKIIDWDYDIETEKAIAQSMGESFGDVAAAMSWTLYVQKVRAAKDQIKALVIISPRQIFSGIKMICGKGWSLDKTAEREIWAGMTKDQRQAIMTALGPSKGL